MRISILLLIVTLFASCTGVKITNQWDKEVEFDEFKTYSLYPWATHNDQVVNDYDKQTILSSIKVEMDKRGYKQVDKKGDLVVSTFVIVEDKTSYQAYSNHYGGWAGYGGGWGYYGRSGYYGYGMGPGYSTTRIYSTEYQQGTLIIDIFRLADKKLIWQGIGSGEMTNNYEKRDRNLPKTIGQIYRRFPVTAKTQKQLDAMNAE